MANWKHRLDVSNFFHSEELSLEEKTKKIIATIKTRPWFAKLYYVDDLSEALEELSDAGEADDVEWFDATWNAIYDIFDAERVWVITR